MSLPFFKQVHLTLKTLQPSHQNNNCTAIYSSPYHCPNMAADPDLEKKQQLVKKMKAEAAAKKAKVKEDKEAKIKAVKYKKIYDTIKDLFQNANDFPEGTRGADQLPFSATGLLFYTRAPVERGIEAYCTGSVIHNVNHAGFRAT